MIPDLLQQKRTLLLGEPMSFQLFVSNALIYASPRKRIIWIAQSDDDGKAFVHSFRTAYSSRSVSSYIGLQVAHCDLLTKIIARVSDGEDTIVVKDVSRGAPLA